MTQHQCIIVGSGINALVCAAVLAKRGRRVLVLERGDRFGGCIRSDEVTAPGFVHDVLSSWYPLFVTSPAYAALAGDLEREGIVFRNTDAPTAVVLPDERFFVLRRSREENVAAMNALAAGDGDRYAESMAELERTLDLTFTLLGSELWTWATAKTVLKAAWRLGPHGLAQFAGHALQSGRSWLMDTFLAEETRACIAPWPLHAGMAPDAPLAGHMARVICFALEQAGCPVVEGGSYRIVEALQRIIEGHGGEMRCEAEVDRVLVEGGRAVGVVTAGGAEHRAEQAIVCSTTPSQLYDRLLDGVTEVPEAVRRQARSFKHGRADMQIHLALDAPPRWHSPDLADVAMVHLTAGLEGAAASASEGARGLLPASPTVVVGQPSALDPSRCPEGKAILWLQLLDMPPVIAGDAAGDIAAPEGGRWTEEVRERYANRVIAMLGRHIHDLDETIVARAAYSPADIEALNVNLVGGDPYGGACTLDQYLLWRPLKATRNHATPVQGLYHIGASTHPGPGLGGVSGLLVANRL